MCILSFKKKKKNNNYKINGYIYKRFDTSTSVLHGSPLKSMVMGYG